MIRPHNGDVISEHCRRMARILISGARRRPQRPLFEGLVLQAGPIEFVKKGPKAACGGPQFSGLGRGGDRGPMDGKGGLNSLLWDGRILLKKGPKGAVAGPSFFPQRN